MTPEDKKMYQASLKSKDTEEWIDLLFYRPIGFRWALFFKRLGVKPNAVTIASIFLGVAAGVLFYFRSLPLNILGMLLLVWANSYDSADGQLARLTGQKSELGRILDGMSGDCWFIAIYFAIAFRLMPEWSYWIFLLAAVAGFCHSKQAMMADYYRNIHLFFLLGKQGSELDNARQEEEKYNRMRWQDGFIQKLFQYFYKNYTANQERLTPCFQRFFQALKERYPDGVAPVEIREQFRQKSLPLMPLTNILSFNTRVIVLFISLLIDMPWLYFVFELTVLNAIFIYMVWKHEKLSREMFNRHLSIINGQSN
ncbi:MAG: CDP-alcohol phosphatidyltransferase family protein [Bacteroidaceae bacterium]|nr:CDP-alcohol phosphatidyltransferase family protein [Bacteroidaceae bacterium]